MSVVIVGLIGVRLAELQPGVAVIVIYVVRLQLRRRCVDGLMDTAPAGLAAAIERRAGIIPGVTDCHQVRVRTSGAHIFVDLHATFSGARSLEDVHRQAEAIEATVRELEPRADVTVHAGPAAPRRGDRDQLSRPCASSHA